MKKLVVVGPGLSMGGVERASSNTINGIWESTTDLDVTFMSIFKKPMFFKINAKTEVIAPVDFNVDYLSLFKTINYLRKNFKSLSKEHHLTILVFGKFYAALVAISLWGLNISYNISDRQSPTFNWSTKIKMINYLAFLIKPPKGVLAQTSVAASYQRKYFSRSTVAVIPNIVRPITFYSEVKRENVILAVGRLGDYLKGFDLLIESFSQLKNQDWELHIAGGDENGQELKDLAARLGVLNRLRFLGKVTDIDRVYAYAGIFVIPSRSEGFPNALAEAMAAGCCCVAFDFVAGPRDIIDNGVSGVIVENGNTQLMAQTLDELIDDPLRRNQLANEAINIGDQLDSQKISNRIVEFLQIK